ncbi:hypothetical protein FFLO_06788 [Filobasidium floriforme]|uniref:Uncharacterized protein n=1 Tax=Filobasidium floriforme TaxID=5210 RepID=A0A8K0JG58_9TREE|nr:uncharacterized protein HD553DRAFT_320643 [Filobasidium floriforme]KAG7527582.1 hypothetical protein FFLO_06788 [Filobasidium floriforme]KAH8077639.1 hypothetical protein HD553DRAFT_320643 [Filobasidium floriforme]
MISCFLPLPLYCLAAVDLCLLGDPDGNSALSLLMSFSGSSTSLSSPSSRPSPSRSPSIYSPSPSTPPFSSPIVAPLSYTSFVFAHLYSRPAVPSRPRPSVDCAEPRQPLSDLV